MRKLGYLVLYGGSYFLWSDLPGWQVGLVLGAVTVVVLAVDFYLRKGDEAILNKVKASQDRYEYEQEKKQKAAEDKKPPKPKLEGNQDHDHE